MNHCLKTTLAGLLDLQSIVFGYALFNFALVWTQAWHYSIGGIAGLVSPWYDPWSYGNQPTRLLIAATFLQLRRPWAYLAALGVSGYLVGDVIYPSSIYEGTLWQEWNYLQRYEPYLVGSWHSQYIFALVISVLCHLLSLGAFASNERVQSNGRIKRRSTGAPVARSLC